MITKLKPLLLLLTLFACKKEEKQEVPLSFYNEETITSDDIETITPEEAATYHKDTEYKYEYRTGTSGRYEYNYNVYGYDDEGNYVSGNINIEDKYGAGVITNEDGEETDVEVEWIDFGKLKATDDDGNEYELEAE